MSHRPRVLATCETCVRNWTTHYAAIHAPCASGAANGCFHHDRAEIEWGKLLTRVVFLGGCMPIRRLCGSPGTVGAAIGFYPDKTATGLHETGRLDAHHPRSTPPESACLLPRDTLPARFHPYHHALSSGPGSITGRVGVWIIRIWN